MGNPKSINILILWCLNNNTYKNAYAGPHTAVAPSGHRRNPFSVILFLGVVVVVYKLCRTKHCSVRYNLICLNTNTLIRWLYK